MDIKTLRKIYHKRICQEIIRITTNPKTGKSYPNFADGTNRNSTDIANGIIKQLEYQSNVTVLSGQTAGGNFEQITRDFLESAFELLHHLQPGNYKYLTHLAISEFEQYEHLAQLTRLIEKLFQDEDIENSELATALGGEYIITPDIVVAKYPISDEIINKKGVIIDPDDNIAILTPMREFNKNKQSQPRKILFASISCKWTLRSDRGQNARTEALNLIRNRKGATPKIVAVTGEPLPSRIQSLALGTGDIDTVYHFALSEMMDTIEELKQNGNSGIEDQQDILTSLINGKRLRDISDLPFDLIN
jgi:hypothetical protein